MPIASGVPASGMICCTDRVMSAAASRKQPDINALVRRAGCLLTLKALEYAVFVPLRRYGDLVCSSI